MASCDNVNVCVSDVVSSVHRIEARRAYAVVRAMNVMNGKGH